MREKWCRDESELFDHSEEMLEVGDAIRLCLFFFELSPWRCVLHIFIGLLNESISLLEQSIELSLINQSLDIGDIE